MNKISMSPL